MTVPVYVIYHFHPEQMEEWQERMSALMPGIKLVTADSPDADKAEVLIGLGPPEGMIAGFKQLKGVFSIAHGVDHMLGDKSFPAHLKLARLVDDSMADIMAEWVMLALLEHHRERQAYRGAQQRRAWEPLPPKLTSGFTVAMMGFRCIGWSRSPKTLEGIESFHGADGLAACLPEADYVVSILPLTKETTDLYDKSVFARMKRGAVFINAGRGLQVVEEDLIAALDSGHLGGAVLDVTRVEPLPAEDPLWTHPKVTVWPHVAGNPIVDSAAPQVVDAIKAFIEGREPANCVDPNREY